MLEGVPVSNGSLNFVKEIFEFLFLRSFPEDGAEVRIPRSLVGGCLSLDNAQRCG